MKTTEMLKKARLRRLQARMWRRAGLTHKEIGTRLGVSLERARQLSLLGEREMKRQMRVARLTKERYLLEMQYWAKYPRTI